MPKPKKTRITRKERKAIISKAEEIARMTMSQYIFTCDARREHNKCILMSEDGSKTYDPIPRRVYEMITEVPYPWKVYLACRTKEKNGKLRLPIWTVPTQGKYLHTQINDSLSDHHAQMLDEEIARGNEILNVGWIATTGKPIDDEEIYRLFDEVLDL
jgi:hypothetical protein